MHGRGPRHRLKTRRTIAAERVALVALLLLGCAMVQATPRFLADSGDGAGGAADGDGEECEEGGEEECGPEWTITWCAYSTTDCSGKTKQDCSVRTDEDMSECLEDYPDGKSRHSRGATHAGASAVPRTLLTLQASAGLGRTLFDLIRLTPRAFGRFAGLAGFYRLKCGDVIDGGQTLMMAQYTTAKCDKYKCVIDTPEGPFEWDEDGKWEKCVINWPEMWGQDQCFAIKGRGSVKLSWEGDPCPNPIKKLGFIVLFTIFGGTSVAVTLGVLATKKKQEQWCWRRKFEKPVDNMTRLQRLDAVKADEDENQRKWQAHHEATRITDERHARPQFLPSAARPNSFPLLLAWPWA